MNFWYLIPAMMSVFGGVQQYRAGKEMEGMAAQEEAIARQNAELEKRELEEQVRRQKIKDDRLQGRTRALAAASGARLEGTPADYLDFMASEQAEELEWMQRAGKSRIDLNLQAGLTRAAGTRLQAKQQKYGLYTSIAQAGAFMGQSGLFTKAPMTTQSFMQPVTGSYPELSVNPYFKL